MLLLTYQGLRRLAIMLVGFTVLLLGVIMLVTPGPGIPTLVVGLSILATEVVWARTLLKHLKSGTEHYTRGLLGWLQKHTKPAVVPSNKKPQL